MSAEKETPALPDLSLYSTPDIAERLLAELIIRHDRDAFVILMERDSDGNEPDGFERFVGHASRLEGMVGSAYRYIRTQNDRSRGNWNYRTRTNADAAEAGDE